MPNPRKPSEKRQNRVTRDVGFAPSNGGSMSLEGLHSSSPVPKPPVPVSAKTRRYWEAFWASPVAQVVDMDADAHLLVRWITYLQMWDEAAKVIREDGQDAEGSQGQRVLHPAMKTMQWLDGAIASIEQRLGLDPKSRALLGLAVNTYKKSAADLMADIQNIAPIALDD